MTLGLSILLLLGFALGAMALVSWLEKREQRRNLTRLDVYRRYIGVAERKRVS